MEAYPLVALPSGMRSLPCPTHAGAWRFGWRRCFPLRIGPRPASLDTQFGGKCGEMVLGKLGYKCTAAWLGRNFQG